MFQNKAAGVFQRLAKLEFLHFDGLDALITWICRAKQFFKYHDTPENEKIRLALYHLRCSYLASKDKGTKEGHGLVVDEGRVV